MVMPLDDVRVIEWGAWLHGPIAGAMLADMGAEVIKIEELRGEPTRGLSSMYGQPIYANAMFHISNRGKKDIALDLRSARGVAVLYELVAKADVFLTNRLDRYAREYKYDWKTLREKNPRLIYAYASSYGPEGPDAEYRASDLCGQARGGLLSISRAPDGTFVSDGGSAADVMGGCVCAYGILLALLARQKTGRGQRVDTSLLGGQVELGRQAFQQYLFGSMPSPFPTGKVKNPMINLYRCQDDKWLAMGVIHPDPHWATFCALLGRPELATDSRYENQTVRGEHIDEILATLRPIFMTKPRDEWVNIFRTAGLPQIDRVQDYDDLANDPQAIANGYVIEVDDPSMGRVRVPGMPVRLSDTPGQVRRLGPELSQHTEEVLVDLLGYSWEQVVQLRNEEVIL